MNLKYFITLYKMNGATKIFLKFFLITMLAYSIVIWIDFNNLKPGPNDNTKGSYWTTLAFSIIIALLSFTAFTKYYKSLPVVMSAMISVLILSTLILIDRDNSNYKSHRNSVIDIVLLVFSILYIVMVGIFFIMASKVKLSEKLE
jgi:lysylphosphatidylglycerol synthetase-like protein (DUF2156 family)